MAGRTRGQGSSWIRSDKRLAIYLRDGLACVYCGRTLEQGAALTLDHVLASHHGGQNTTSNLVTACLSCNSAKQDLTLADWLVTLDDDGELAAFIARQTATSITALRKQAKAILANRRPAGPVTNAIAA